VEIAKLVSFAFQKGEFVFIFICLLVICRGLFMYFVLNLGFGFRVNKSLLSFVVIFFLQDDPLQITF
jgi:hypothetical protein